MTFLEVMKVSLSGVSKSKIKDFILSPAHIRGEEFEGVLTQFAAPEKCIYLLVQSRKHAEYFIAPHYSRSFSARNLLGGLGIVRMLHGGYLHYSHKFNQSIYFTLSLIKIHKINLFC